MPSHRIPRRQTLHRVACIALYRAVLTSCSKIKIPDSLKQSGPVCPLKHLVRKRFRSQIHTTSPRLCVEALQKGYKAEELLREAGDGDEAANSKIIETLRRNQIKAARTRSQTPPPKARDHVYPEPYPGSKKVLETRPLPLEKLTGRRHVPHAVGGNNVPFLRHSAKQSPFLSRMIKDNIKRRQKRMDYTSAMDDLTQYGKDEEMWEKLVGESVYEKDGSTWDEFPTQFRRIVERKMQYDREQGRIKALKVLEIATQERKLWEEERRARRHEKRLKKWDEKLARKKSKVDPSAADE